MNVSFLNAAKLFRALGMQISYPLTQSRMCRPFSSLFFLSFISSWSQKGEIEFIFLFIMKKSYILKSERRHSKVRCT